MATEKKVPIDDKELPSIPEKNAGQTDSSFLQLATSWGSNIGMHGIPNITRSSSTVKKILWTLLLLAGLSLTIVQIKAIVDKFYTYPITVARGSEINLPRKFPAVTVCNQSPARNSKVMSAIASPGKRRKRGALPDPDDEKFTGLTTSMYSAGPTSRNLSAMDSKTVPDSVRMTYMFLDFYNSLTDAVKTDSGYQINDMLIDCSLGTSYCSVSNFTRFLHPMFGNCYTFNAAVTNSTRVSVKQQGPLFGLTLTLYIDQPDYVGTVAQSAGVVVVLHEPTVQPFPEESGIRVPPGRETYIGMTQTYKKLLGHPYSDNCAVDYETANAELNMYKAKSLWALPNVNYTKMVCLKTCIQRKTEAECNCSSPKLPPSNTTRTPALPKCEYEYNSTSMTLSSQAVCMQAIEESQFGICRAGCQSQCDEIKYSAAVSMSSWPSGNYEEDALNQMMMYNPMVRENMERLREKEMKAIFLSKNIVKIIVFFDDPQMLTEISMEGYAITDLLSDMGGQVGLWLGLSVLTIFEVVEMLLDFVALATTKVTLRKPRNPQQQQPQVVNLNGKVSPTEDTINFNRQTMWVDEKHKAF